MAQGNDDRREIGRVRKRTSPPRDLRAEATGELDIVGFAERLSQARFAQVLPFYFLVGEDERVRPRATIHTAVVDVSTLPRIEAPPLLTDAQLKRPLILPLDPPRADDDRIHLGRLPESDLILEDALVSRVHAQIRVRPDYLTLADEGSSNGTFVDGKRLAPGREEILMPGSRICFGALELLFVHATDCWAWLRGRRS